MKNEIKGKSRNFLYIFVKIREKELFIRRFHAAALFCCWREQDEQLNMKGIGELQNRV